MRFIPLLPFAFALARVAYAQGEDGDDGSDWIPDDIESGVDKITSKAGDAWGDFTDAAVGAVTTLTSDGEPYWASVTSLADGAKSTVLSHLSEHGVLSAADSAIEEGKSYASEGLSAAESAYHSATSDDDDDDKTSGGSGGNGGGSSGGDGGNAAAASSDNEDSSASSVLAVAAPALVASLVGAAMLA